MRASVLWIVVIGAIIGLAATRDRFVPPPLDDVPASALRVIDGDTVALGQEHIRLLHIDAPEIHHYHCTEEWMAGLHAKAELQQLIKDKRVTIRRAKNLDPYGRTLAVLIVDNKEIGAILMADGLALPYKPGFIAHRERTSHWCGPGNW